jgi:hypothetical protein
MSYGGLGMTIVDTVGALAGASSARATIVIGRAAVAGGIE